MSDLANPYRVALKHMAAICFCVALLGSFGGAGLALTFGPHQQVVKVVEHKKTVEIKEVDTDKPDCLAGKVGVVEAIRTEKVNMGDKDNPEAWTWGTTMTLSVDGVSHTCYFEGPSYMADVVRPGMKFNPAAGSAL